MKTLHRGEDLNEQQPGLIRRMSTHIETLDISDGSGFSMTRMDGVVEGLEESKLPEVS